MSLQFKQRLIVSILSILAIAFFIYFSQIPWFKPLFFGLNAVIVAVALLEYYRLTINRGFHPATISGTLCGVIYIMSLYPGIDQTFWRPLPLLILLFSLLILSVLFFRNHSQVMANLAITFFGLVYLAVPIGCAIQINYWPSIDGIDGRMWLAYVLIVTKMTDIGAYFTGKTIGQRPLAPHISPKKTIEGAIGGIVAATLASILFAVYLDGSLFTLIQSFWLGILIAILAQLGDLVESNLKRDAGVKDSNQIPGLGGVLDQADSLVFTLPLVYLLIQMK